MATSEGGSRPGHRSAAMAALFLALFSAWLLLAFALTRPAQALIKPAPIDESLIWPLSGTTIPDATMSSPFGPRWQASQHRYDYHAGIDIAAPLDTPIHAIAGGTVFKAGWLSDDAGLGVVLRHPDLGFYSAYLHLNSTPVTVSQVITQGQVIGYVGNSGTTNFYHVHTEIRLTATDYPTSTRNVMGYLPRPDTTTPTIQIASLQSDPIYSPTVSLVITVPRNELDLNRLRVTLQDRATAAVIDDQFVDFNLRVNTGSDALDQDGIRLIPGHFNTSTVEYVITGTFYALSALDSFTLTAQAIDLAGHAGRVSATAADTTPPGRVTSLRARRLSPSSIILSWVAPGDSGPVGRAMVYGVRYAHVPINSDTWYDATILSDPPEPITAGLVQQWLVALPVADPVYFALRATDDEGNVSPVSNSAHALWAISLPVAFKAY